jgi:uncharacterized protein YbcV (DUF1398 family)
MTAELIEILRQAQQGAVAARPAVSGFPVFAEVLRAAGVTAIETSIATAGSIYHLLGGAVAESFEPIAAPVAVVPDWDQAAVIAAIQIDQAGQSTFPEFLRDSWAAGVISFRVDLNARTCTYFGVGNTSYVEIYPAAAPLP